MVLEPEADAVLAQDAGRGGAVALHDLADAHDQVDAERIREAACRRQLIGGRADAAREADDPNAAPRERLACELHVLGGRPLPVQVAEPEVDRVESDCSDPLEELVEARGEGLDRREGRIGGVVERAPLVRSSVAELLGDVVRGHEREHEGAAGGMHGRRHLST